MIAKRIAQSLTRTARDDTKSKITVTISGPARNVEKVGQLLRWIDWCSSIGHSASTKLFVDGDGAAQIKVSGLPEEIHDTDFDSNSDPESFGLD